MAKRQNIFEVIEQCGHDEGFFPFEPEDFQPTNAPAGSPEKIEILRRRIEEGLPLWHKDDRRDYNDLIGAIRPRENA